MQTQKAYEFLIFGKVQGVGFRRFVKAEVDKINIDSMLISGYVCNLDDGSVRVVAIGQDKDIGRLKVSIELGNGKSVIKRVVMREITDECHPQNESTSFVILS